ncbi:hypothetical protein GIB67_032133 [Kingdonia uniflora]|uniref:Uncharacterized protein n=1 Tax=Kingdonia uniflora TaxID=39325 RepID=A0A7J7MX58_9MAGN|nr:hypothetical protein GIB67_032133 [Kingdonia uniflora]
MDSWRSLFLDPLQLLRLWFEHHYINPLHLRLLRFHFLFLNPWFFWIYYREHVYSL